jgi:hypothetical protein
MIWRILIIVGILGFLVGGSLWFRDGQQILSKDREEVVTIVKDPLFGPTKQVSYEPRFRFGLLPLDATPLSIPASFAFVAGTSLMLIGLGLWKLRKQQ